MLGITNNHFGGKHLSGDALDTRARARGRATRWKGSMPALAREPLIRVSRSFFASVRAIRNRASPGARRFRPADSCGGLASTADDLKPPPLQTRAWPGRGPKVSREGWLRLPHSNSGTPLHACAGDLVIPYDSCLTILLQWTRAPNSCPIPISNAEGPGGGCQHKP